MQIRNPIIPGFNPDPSCIRVEEDFYLATSSFSYFPGIPIYHSWDLIHWEHISYAFTDPAQIDLEPERISRGLFAPTLRYHDGTFYVIVTNMSTNVTGVVTAGDPRGPWSAPHLLPKVCDPDLFWDDDGKCYVAGCMVESAHLAGTNCGSRIGAYELNTTTWEYTGEMTGLWTGALFDSLSPEAPHLYKKDGWYYLMISEGGTEHFHAVTIARSKSVLGPYEGYDGNPVLTHRHLPKNYPICATGHADIFDTPNGDWYMVFLASRTYGGYHKNMGRETFIAPVVWENGWPVVSPETGRCEFTYPAPKGLKSCKFMPPLKRDDFDGDKLALPWNTLGSPVNEVYRLADSRLYLKAIAEPLRPDEADRQHYGRLGESKPIRPRAISFVGRRQQHMDFSATAKMRFNPKDKETAGLAVLQNNHANLRIELGLEDGKKVLRVLKYEVNTHAEMGRHGRNLTFEETCFACVPWKSESAILRIWTDGQEHHFWAGEDEASMKPMCVSISGGFLGSETSGGFVGAYIGMFCSGNGKSSDNEAAFDWFEYSGE